MENTVNKKQDGFGEDDGAMKIPSDFYTPTLKALQAKQISLLSEKVELDKKNVAQLSAAQKAEQKAKVVENEAVF